MGLLALRNPVKREHFREQMAQVMDRMTEASLSTPEKYEAIKEQMREDGYDINEDVTY